MTIYQLTYHPCFDTQFRHGQVTQQYFRAVAMSSRKKAKAIELLLSKESGKKEKGNCFDKDWADKHAASDKGSYDKQHEFEDGQDFEEAAIDGFLHRKLLSKIRLHGSGDDNEVNKFEEFDASITSLGVSVSLESVVVARFPPLRIRLRMLFLVVFVPVTFFPFSFL